MQYGRLDGCATVAFNIGFKFLPKLKKYSARRREGASL